MEEDNELVLAVNIPQLTWEFETIMDLDVSPGYSGTPAGLHTQDSGYSTGASQNIYSPSTEDSRPRKARVVSEESFFSPDLASPDLATTSTPYYKNFIGQVQIPKFSLVTPVKSHYPRIYNIFCDEETNESPKVDIIKDLRPYEPVLNQLISYLSCKDLSVVAQVSKHWNKIFEQNQVAKNIKKTYLDNKAEREKENENYKELFSLQLLQDNFGRNPLHNIHNHFHPNAQISSGDNNLNPASAEPLSRFQLFRNESEKLLGCEELRCCPRCSYPSRVTPFDNRGICSRESCQYTFCLNCTTPFHGTDPCPVNCTANGRVNKKCQVGSEKSKKNLRRLCYL